MLNEIQFIGNLTKKPELRIIKKKSGDDTFVTTLTVAVDRRKAGLPIDGTDFFDVTAWGKTAENCSTYLEKGSRVLVKGYVFINSSEKDGQKRFFTQFTAQRVTFLSKSNQNTKETTNINKQNTTWESTNINSVNFNPGHFIPMDTDDIPF